MSLSANKALLLSDDLPAAPSGKTYQAWTIGEKIRSAGLIHPEDGKASLEFSGIEEARQVGVTVEPAGGSKRPTSDPFLRFDVA